MQSIIKISEATAIALHSMIYICNKGKETSSVKEIAKKFEISENHLSKVLQRLVKAGYLKSLKGPKGGFILMQNKENTSFAEIYEVIEGKSEPLDCLFATAPCKGKKCILGGLIVNINREFKEYFNKNKISDFKFA